MPARGRRKTSLHKKSSTTPGNDAAKVRKRTRSQKSSKGDNGHPETAGTSGTMERLKFFGELHDNCNGETIHRREFGVAFYRGLIWVIGGLENISQIPTRNVSTFDPNQGVWNHDMPKISINRRQHSVVVHGESVYACGGRWVKKALQSFEFYDPDTGSWADKSPMTEARADFGLGVVGSKFFAVGGLDDKYNPVASAEFWTIGNIRWTVLHSSHFNRLGRCQLQVLNDKIYIFGSADPGSGMVYDPNVDSCRDLRRMQLARVDPAMVALSNRIYVFGGKLGEERCDIIESYDPPSGIWIYYYLRLINPRYQAKAVAVPHEGGALHSEHWNPKYLHTVVRDV